MIAESACGCHIANPDKRRCAIKGSTAPEPTDISIIAMRVTVRIIPPQQAIGRHHAKRARMLLTKDWLCGPIGASLSRRAPFALSGSSPAGHAFVRGLRQCGG